MPRAATAVVTAGCIEGMDQAIQPPHPCPTITALLAPRDRTMLATSAARVKVS